MTLKSNIQGSGASSEHSEAICGELAPYVTAAGSTQATATLLRRMARHYVNAGSGGVVIPPGIGNGDFLQDGDELEISNGTVSAINAYPPLGASFVGSSANAAVSVAAGYSLSVLVLSRTLYMPRYYATASGVGAVNSVGLALPGEFTVTNSPVTNSGTLTGAWVSQTQNKVFASPNGSSGIPAFRPLVSGDIPSLSYAPQTSGTSILYGNGSGGFSNVTIGSGLSFSIGTLSATGSSGTVTSVGLSLPAIITVSGSPVTGSGTLTGTLATQGSNTIFAGPTSGAAAQPTFRSMVAADLVNNGANPTGAVGASAVNGSATTWMRSDSAPPLTANMICDTISGIIDGGGSAISSGAHIYIIVPWNCTIVTATSLADQSGSVALSWWKCSYANFDAGSTHPVAGDKITASAPPSISSATKSQDSTLTGWTTSLSKGDVLAFVATGNATSITRVTGCLTVNKT